MLLLCVYQACECGVASVGELLHLEQAEENLTAEVDVLAGENARDLEGGAQGQAVQNEAFLRTHLCQGQ